MKKIIQVVLALCMAMVLFTGCSSKKEEKDSANISKQTETTDTEQGEKKEDTSPIIIK